MLLAAIIVGIIIFVILVIRAIVRISENMQHQIGFLISIIFS